MFLEKVGLLCFGYVRPLFFYLFLLIPLFFAGGYVLIEYISLRNVKERCLEIAQKDKCAFEKKKRKERFLNRYAHPDPFFLDRQIESLVFLQNEQSKIKSLVNHPALLNKNELLERSRFLSNKNRLMFIEGKIRSSSNLKETEEKQRFPVQMGTEDLEKILAYIEDIRVGNHEPLQESPQLILSDFKLVKKEHPLHLEIFEVEMELLKREWSNL